MPTVKCNRTDCAGYGKHDGICIKRFVRWAGHCLDYTPRVDHQMMNTFNPHCTKRGGRYKSDRITGVLK